MLVAGDRRARSRRPALAAGGAAGGGRLRPSRSWSASVSIDQYGGARAATQHLVDARPHRDRAPRRTARLDRGAGPAARLAATYWPPGCGPHRRCSATGPRDSGFDVGTAPIGRGRHRGLLRQRPDGPRAAARPDRGRRVDVPARGQRRRLRRHPGGGRTSSRRSPRCTRTSTPLGRDIMPPCSTCSTTPAPARIPASPGWSSAGPPRRRPGSTARCRPTRRPRRYRAAGRTRKRPGVSPVRRPRRAGGAGGRRGRPCSSVGPGTAAVRRTRPPRR